MMFEPPHEVKEDLNKEDLNIELLNYWPKKRSLNLDS
ncbi:hypothetical protein NIES23_23780 [Trichormus variabilis NIES-23]|uniref:Uncharacterized protein n=1 Tax=Trichormus variabilis NIES-23 TaxID=1973479 RepID=A0A1Z4KKX1_ANAVA|nr:hypothetical protein NIES23_23780 [Trichormus variabilis NIES-23]